MCLVKKCLFQANKCRNGSLTNPHIISVMSRNGHSHREDPSLEQRVIVLSPSPKPQQDILLASEPLAAIVQCTTPATMSTSSMCRGLSGLRFVAYRAYTSNYLYTQTSPVCFGGRLIYWVTPKGFKGSGCGGRQLPEHRPGGYF